MPAVESGLLLHVSATSIKKYLACPAQWGFRYIDGLDEGAKPGTEAGKSLHIQHEDWFQFETPPSHKSLQRLFGDPRYPRPNDRSLFIEHPRDFRLKLLAASVPVQGRMDLLDLGRDIPHIYDLKTCKTYDYCLDSEELTRDLQLLLYGKYVLTELAPKHSHVGFSHAYCLTSRPGYEIVTSEPVSRKDIDEHFEGIEQVVSRMKTDARAASGADLEAKVGPACKAYGGCPYRENCPAYQAANPNQKEVSAMNIEDKLANRPRAQGINPPDAAAPVPTPPAAVKVQPDKVEITDGTGKTWTLTAAPTVETSPTPPPEPKAGAETWVITRLGYTMNGRELYLYVDCAPAKGPTEYIDLEDEIEKRAGPIAKAHGVEDVRQIKFGEGTAALVADFRKNPPKGHVVARSGGLSSMVIEVLRTRATVVVEG